MRAIGYILFTLFLLLPQAASAHKIADSYLRLQIDGKAIRGEWDIALYDLGKTAVLEEKQQNDRQFLKTFALDHLHVSAGGHSCTLHPVDPMPDDSLNGRAPDLVFTGDCETTITKLTIDYSPFLVLDPQYACLAAIMAGNNSFSERLSAQKPYFNFETGAVLTKWDQFKVYLHEGIWHIWLGYEHILFLISLLLSAAFVRKEHAWEPRDGFTGTFLQVLKIVTAFTIAHSVTLSLVIFNIISLPSRFVESTIALSIAIAAVNNLYPVIHKRLWLLTFCFGFIHGMGFAGALKELGLPDTAKWVALVAFNLGVEIGQVSIVAVVLPFIYAMRRSTFYRQRIFRIISGLIIVISLMWFTQRAFELTLFQRLIGD
jgi:hypothetical protein